MFPLDSVPHRTSRLARHVANYAFDLPGAAANFRQPNSIASVPARNPLCVVDGVDSRGLSV